MGVARLPRLVYRSLATYKDRLGAGFCAAQSTGISKCRVRKACVVSSRLPACHNPLHHLGREKRHPHEVGDINERCAVHMPDVSLRPSTHTCPPSAQSRWPTRLVFSIPTTECPPDEIAGDEVRGLRGNVLSRAGRRGRAA